MNNDIVVYGLFGAALLAVASIVMQKRIYLNFVLVLSSLFILCGLYFFAEASDFKDLWMWFLGLTALNLVQLIALLNNRTYFIFSSEEERELYEGTFQHLSLKQFNKLMEIGYFVDVQAGEMLTEEGKTMTDLIVICKGKVKVIINDKIVAICKKGYLIGEMSFLNRTPASATVYTLEDTKYVRWSQEAIRKLFDADSDLHHAMLKVFNVDHIIKHVDKINNPCSRL